MVNMHFAVDMNENTMRMLYKIDDGFLKEEHYGLALALVANLPAGVIQLAEHVSRKLENQIAQKKAASKQSALVARRKLLLALKDQLEELAAGPMNGEPLRNFMKSLQAEFVARMEAIEDAHASSDVEDAVEEVIEISSEESGDDSGGESLSQFDGMLV